MIRHLRPALSLFVFFFLLTGFAYPFLVMGIGQAVTPEMANGSLIERDGKIIGSSLIGQNFTTDVYFHPRPSAAGSGYDAMNSAASNLAPTSPELVKGIGARVAELKKNGITAPIPADMVTTSASGLDPDITPESALLQVGRVAEARHVEKDKVKALVEKQTEGKIMGVWGVERVNVLKLNLALDAAYAMTSQ